MRKIFNDDGLYMGFEELYKSLRAKLEKTESIKYRENFNIEGEK